MNDRKECSNEEHNATHTKEVTKSEEIKETGETSTPHNSSSDNAADIGFVKIVAPG